MIRRIKLVNFMSHRDTAIELADGLTVLTGQNNCGKSAIVAALQILTGNARGDFMVRHGERECVVTVETQEGHVIEWRRKGEAVSYRLNGRDVHRLQGGVPDDLHELLRLPAVQADGENFNVHFAEQKNPIFLLNETAARRAVFFASSSDAAKLIEMQTVHRKRIQEAKTRESEFAKREARLSAQVDTLAPLGEAAALLADVEKSYESVLECARKRELLSALNTDLDHASETSSGWVGKTSVLGTLGPPPVLADTKQLQSAIEGLIRARHEVSYATEVSKGLRTLDPPPELTDTAPCARAILSLAITQSQINANDARNKACKPLNVPPKLAAVVPLGEMIRELGGVVGSVRLFCERSELHRTLPPLPEFKSTVGLDLAIERIKKEQIQHRAWDARWSMLESCSAPPIFHNTFSLRTRIECLVVAAGSVTRQEVESRWLSNLSAPPAISDANQFRSTLDFMDLAIEHVGQLKSEVGELRDQQRLAEQSLLSRAEALGTCPVCHQEFDPNRLIALSAVSVGEAP